MDMQPKRDGNHVPVSPITFLHRAASAYADRTSLIYGSATFTWRQTYHRCCRVAAALQEMTVSKNDVVSVLSPNSPALYELHFAVPMAGGVFNAINSRLDAAGVATIIGHAQPKVLLVDYEYIGVVIEAIKALSTGSPRPVMVVIDDHDKPTGARMAGAGLEYEQLVARGDQARYPPREVEDEWDAVTLNYTSGTTAVPKGVVYSHRGSYLSTVANMIQS